MTPEKTQAMPVEGRKLLAMGDFQEEDFGSITTIRRIGWVFG